MRTCYANLADQKAQVTLSEILGEKGGREDGILYFLIILLANYVCLCYMHLEGWKVYSWTVLRMRGNVIMLVYFLSLICIVVSTF